MPYISIEGLMHDSKRTIIYHGIGLIKQKKTQQQQINIRYEQNENERINKYSNLCASFMVPGEPRYRNTIPTPQFYLSK